MVVKKLIKKAVEEPATLAQRSYLYDLRKRLGESVVGIREMTKVACSAAISAAQKTMLSRGMKQTYGTGAELLRQEDEYGR